MGDAHVHGRKVIQLVLVRAPRLAAGKIVSYVGEVEEEGDGINEEGWSDLRGSEGMA